MSYLAGKFQIKHKDFCHARNFYKLMHEWLMEQDYGGASPRSDKKFPEVYYSQREYPPPKGREYKWWWRCEREGERPTKFYRYRLNVDIHGKYFKDTEIIYDNKKFKTHWGEFMVNVTAWVEVDYQGQWKNHWFLKHFLEIFWRRVVKNDLLWHRDMLYREAYRFASAIKTFLQMRTYLPEPEGSRFWIRDDFSG